MMIEPYWDGIVSFYCKGVVEREEVTLDAEALTRLRAPLSIADGARLRRVVEQTLEMIYTYG